MKRTELKKLIDLDQFYSQVEQIAKDCDCTLLEASQEYSRINGIDDDLLAQIIKAARGKFKTRLQEECEQLGLIR